MLQDKLSQKGNALICPTAVIIRNDCILLGLRNYTSDKWKEISVWTKPVGRCHASETLEEPLRREIKEEVAIDKLEIVEFIGETSGAKKEDVVPIFLCKTEQNFKIVEPEKFSQWRWVPIAEYLKREPWDIMNPAAYKLISEFLQSRL